MSQTSKTPENPRKPQWTFMASTATWVFDDNNVAYNQPFAFLAFYATFSSCNVEDVYHWPIEHSDLKSGALTTELPKVHFLFRLLVELQKYECNLQYSISTKNCFGVFTKPLAVILSEIKILPKVSFMFLIFSLGQTLA
jgi:hypothetical protein